MFALNRFVWDKPVDQRSGAHERRRAALAIAQVRSMKAQKIRQNAKGAVLELLAVTFEEADAPAGKLRLEFAGGGTVLLEVDCIEAQLADLGAAGRRRASRPINWTEWTIKGRKAASALKEH